MSGDEIYDDDVTSGPLPDEKATKARRADHQHRNQRGELVWAGFPRQTCGWCRNQPRSWDQRVNR